MHKISRIKESKRKNGRYHIYMEKGEGEEYTGTVSEDTLIKLNLLRAREITKEEYESIRSMEVIDQGVHTAINYISYRMRSRHEVFSHLKAKEFEDEVIDEVMERIDQLNLLDDLQFAEAFIRTKRDTTGKGPRVIRQELYQKGIDESVIERAMQEFPDEQILDNAVKLIEKKAAHFNNESQRKQEQKLMQFMMTKGFPTEIIKQAIDIAEVGQSDDDEWESMVHQGEKLLRRHTDSDGKVDRNKLKNALFRKGFPFELIQRFMDEYTE
ncbi:recombination regulator RecX [Salisediminibacterium beveridgei]|uniref:Regulatory protein RecX n=1 Tax=Salisediminibacterium beveridgei TaxID=632773 RepID=A0A1D7QXB4_9BACI|nr:recombination regulator RecX [Salisediminibacterium beveridgei]AOM83651.1 Regulatory protein recX [Salisediminibacterium beveridgei]